MVVIMAKTETLHYKYVHLCTNRTAAFMSLKSTQTDIWTQFESRDSKVNFLKRSMPRQFKSGFRPPVGCGMTM